MIYALVSMPLARPPRPLDISGARWNDDESSVRPAPQLHLRLQRPGVYLRQQLHMQVDRHVRRDVLLSDPVRPRTVLLFADDAHAWHVACDFAFDFALADATARPGLLAIHSERQVRGIRDPRVQQTRSDLAECRGWS